MGLGSESATAALRHMLGAFGLSTGTLVTPDENRARSVQTRIAERYGLSLAITHQPAGVQRRKRPWHAQLGVGGMLEAVSAHDTREEAITAGMRAWLERRDRDVAEICRARGGTLDWGMSIAPMSAPQLLEPRDGESAWDVVGRTPREAPVGTAWISGVRPSGEAL